MIELSPSTILPALVIAAFGALSATVYISHFFSKKVDSHEFYEKSKVLDEMKKAGANVGENKIKEWAQKLGEASEPKEAFKESIKGGWALTVLLFVMIFAYIWEQWLALALSLVFVAIFGIFFLRNLPKYLTITGEE